MASKLILKKNAGALLNNSPTGYQYLTLDGTTLSTKDGATLTAVGGGGASDLETLLSLGASAGTYSIELDGGGNLIMSDSGNINHSGGGQINLSMDDEPGDIMISTDNANWTTPYINMSGGSGYLDIYGGAVANKGITINAGNFNNDGSLLQVKMSQGVRIGMYTANYTNGSGGSGGLGIEVLNSGYTAQYGGYRGIVMKDNTSTTLVSRNATQPAIIIGSQNSTINSAITNSVIIGGSTVTATKSNMVYLPKVNINDITNYADDAAAGAGGLTTGDIYRTGGALMIKL